MPGANHWGLMSGIFFAGIRPTHPSNVRPAAHCNIPFRALVMRTKHACAQPMPPVSESICALYSGSGSQPRICICNDVLGNGVSQALVLMPPQ